MFGVILQEKAYQIGTVALLNEVQSKALKKQITHFHGKKRTSAHMARVLR
ncbi:hypothetical protein [Peribacillus simplex]|jgi:hypothetical protein|nr:hypothetical protein [Peribacillus simplex]